MTESKEWEKFLPTVTQIEKQREFDRKIDRLKKSSATTTFWAIFGGIVGLYGLAYFYLNRLFEELVIPLTGIIPSLSLASFFTRLINPFYFLGNNILGLDSSTYKKSQTELEKIFGF